MIPLETREQLKKEATETLQMIENYPKKFDVIICIWSEGKNEEEVIAKVNNQLSGVRFTISEIIEVNDY